jgi:hypothetical protein
MKKITQKTADKHVSCYDNGGVENGGSIDRYTVVYINRRKFHDLPRSPNGVRPLGWWDPVQYVCMNCAPFHPQGFGQHRETEHRIDVRPGSWGPVSMGRKCHLGVRIPFRKLPVDCRKLVIQDLKEIWR